jgi:serine/threonine protein phosphatase PrpC
MNIEKIIDIVCQGKNDEKVEDFLKFLSDKLWNQYKEHLMDNILVAENKVKSLAFLIPNAKEGKEYSQTVNVPDENMVLVEVSGISEEMHGLTITVAEDGHSFTISGLPTLEPLRNGGTTTAESTFELTLCYKYKGIFLPEDRSVLERKIPFVINQDPRKLWKNLPVDWENMPEPRYQNEDVQCEYVKVEALNDGASQKDIVAASKRGRSHAQEAKPRDDHFKMAHLENGWYIMAVADGAGSAMYSREGSRIACETVISHCEKELEKCQGFEDNINLWHLDQGSVDAGKLISADVYRIVGNAALKAHKAINEEAKQQQLPSKTFATTLLLAICKKFEFGWFVASFWVGDGAMCLYDKEAHSATLLGIPDEGEYAGQTRFLTMPEIFSNPKEFYSRLKCKIVPDFTALFLMTDGVSDPKFETDANLNNPDKWDALWEDLKEYGVDLSDDNEAAKDQLLNWLDFWSPGNHDDRTIAILY